MTEGDPTIQPEQLEPQDIIEEPEQNEIPERREQLDPDVKNYWEEQITELRQLVNEQQMQIEELERKINIDDLTELKSFAYFKKRIDQEIADVKDLTKKTESLGIVFIDLNKFKSINDTYGHTAGDEILVKVADIINSKIRPETDWAVRRSGDEFLIVIGGVKQTKIEQAFKSLRDRINGELGKSIDIDGQEVPVSLSMGMASVAKSGPNATWGELAKKAEDFMYEEKEGSR